MRRGRTIRTAAIIVIVLVALSGVPFQTVGRVPGQSTTTIVWYNNSDPTRNAWERTMVTAFEKAYPAIKVQLQIVPWAQFDTKLSALWAANTAPDVWSQWGQSGFRDYLNRNMLLDQTQYVTANAKALGLSDMSTKLRNLYTVDGKTYGIPFDSNGSYVFYNEDLFRKAALPDPPASWDDRSWTWAAMLSDAQKLTNDYGNPAQAEYGVLVNFWPSEVALPLLWNGSVFPANAFATGVPTTNSIAAPANIKAFQTVADLTYKDKVQPDPAILQGFSTLSDPIMSGRLAMELTGYWDLWVIDAAKFKWNVAPLPWVATNRDVLYRDAWFIARSSQHPQQAWDLVQFLTGVQGDTALVNQVHLAPSHQSLLPLYYKQFPSISPARLKTVYLGALKYGVESSNHLLANFGAIDNSLSQDIQPIMLGKTTAAQQLPVAQANLNRVLKSMK